VARITLFSHPQDIYTRYLIYITRFCTFVNSSSLSSSDACHF
jgi:hypothetical protein